VYREIEAVGERHLPAGYRNAGIVIHTADIYGGNGKFDAGRDSIWTWERRKAILDDLAQIPNKANILITTAAVERAKFPATLKVPAALTPKEKANLTVQAQAAAYMACLMEVDIWLRKNAKNENCMVIVEDNNEARAIIRQVHQFHQDKSIPWDDLANYFPLRRVREDPAFQTKRPDHPLVLADFIAFIVKRVYMRDARVSPFFEPWRKRFGALAVTKDVRLPD